MSQNVLGNEKDETDETLKSNLSPSSRLRETFDF
jgi:hypothetical protein